MRCLNVKLMLVQNQGPFAQIAEYVPSTVQAPLVEHEMWGLISRTGVPSNISIPSIAMVQSDIETTFTMDMPMGLGRTGEHVLNTPLGLD